MCLQFIAWHHDNLSALWMFFANVCGRNVVVSKGLHFIQAFPLGVSMLAEDTSNMMEKEIERTFEDYEAMGFFAIFHQTVRNQISLQHQCICRH